MMSFVFHLDPIPLGASLFQSSLSESCARASPQNLEQHEADSLGQSQNAGLFTYGHHRIATFAKPLESPEEYFAQTDHLLKHTLAAGT
jgi:hypothetical protein